MFKNKKLTLLALSLFSLIYLNAEEATDKDDGLDSAWCGIAFVNPIQYPDDMTNVRAFRFAFTYAYNPDVYGFDFGFICDSENAAGWQFALANNSSDTVRGMSWGVFNLAGREMHGAQLSLFYNRAGHESEDRVGKKAQSSGGFQAAFNNCVDTVFSGVQLGMVNVSLTMLKGWQIGIFNIATRPESLYEGIQTEEYKEARNKSTCKQLGVINYNPRGFLPLTILINF